MKITTTDGTALRAHCLEIAALAEELARGLKGKWDDPDRRKQLTQLARAARKCQTLTDKVQLIENAAEHLIGEVRAERANQAEAFASLPWDDDPPADHEYAGYQPGGIEEAFFNSAKEAAGALSEALVSLNQPKETNHAE